MVKNYNNSTEAERQIDPSDQERIANCDGI